MAVRLFIGNLPYTATEADLREHFSAVAPPSHIVLPVDRYTGRPRGFAFVEYTDPAHAAEAIKRFNGQPFSGRPIAVSEARPREERSPGPRPPGSYGPRTPIGDGFAPPPRGDRPGRNFGPDAKPRRGGQAFGGKKRNAEGGGPKPIPERTVGRSYSLDDAADGEDVPADFDNFASSAGPSQVKDEEDDQVKDEKDKS